MTNKGKKYCEQCEERIAKYECPDCGSLYCKKCADECFMECDCQEPSYLRKLKYNPYET